MANTQSRPLLVKGGFYEKLVELLESEGLCMDGVPHEQAMLVGDFVVETVQRYGELRSNYETYKYA